MGRPRKESIRVAENITNAMGTWSFVISFLSFCVVWMAWNRYSPVLHFDAYPFIFLNLMLSLIAAVQGSVIMISQKYQDKKRDDILHHIDKLEKKHDRDLMEVKRYLKKLTAGDTRD